MRAPVDPPDGLPVLEEPCEKCRGERLMNAYEAGWVNCSLCEGAGHVPTEFGERVLALMRHNFRPLYEAMNADG